MTLDDVKTGPERTVNATVRLDPATIGDDAYWVQAIAWQGGGLVVDQLERVSPGVYETTKPIPVHGTWKTLVRLQRDNYVAGVPIYMPEDTEIPAPAVPAPAELRAPVRRRDGDPPARAEVGRPRLPRRRSPTRSSPRSCSACCCCSAGC